MNDNGSIIYIGFLLLLLFGLILFLGFLAPIPRGF